MVEQLRIAVLIALAAIVAVAAWMIVRKPLQAWVRDSRGEPWFRPMPLSFSLMPVTWQGWLVALAILLLTFVLGLLGASGAFGPGHHLGGR